MDERVGGRIEPVKYLVGKMEAAVLLLVGAAVLYFSIVGEYQILMNVRFRWLSISGGLLLLIMGLSLLFARQKGSMQGVGAFLLLILITVIGRPYIPSESSRMNVLPEFGSALKAQIDEDRFAQKKLQTVFTPKEMPRYEFVTMGAVKRLPELDEKGGFALMDSLMVCCAADMFGIGFFVPVDNPDEYNDGDVLVVCGRLGESDSPIQLDNFRFGNAMMSVVHEDRILQPELIFRYDRMAAMPSITESMDYEKISVFRDLLIETGLWEALQEEGDFTVFAPVNEALEKVDQRLFLDENRDELRNLLSNHIVPGRLFAADLYDRESLVTLHNKKIDIHVSNGRLMIEDARVLMNDKEAKNGVIHYVYPVITVEEPDGR
jgi:hypothetical protein